MDAGARIRIACPVLGEQRLRLFAEMFETEARGAGGVAVGHGNPLLHAPGSGTSGLKKGSHDGLNQMACDARAPLVRIGRNLVDPAAYTLEARDGGADNRTVQFTDEEEFRLDATLDADKVCGRVPGWVVCEHTIPKPHDSVVIGGPVHAN